MPELPEMENYRRLLSDKLLGRRIVGITIHREKSINMPVESFTGLTKGQTIQRIGRRGKQIIFYLGNERVLLLHLMLGGWMYLGTEEDQPERTFQVILDFGDVSLYFIGLRLGYLHLLSQEQLEEVLSNLGPEPDSPLFTSGMFSDRLRKKRGMLKPVLVDQKVMAGIGNCYSDEICFEAHLLPMRKCQDLTDAELLELYRATRLVLGQATEMGGYMENPLFQGDRRTGSYDEQCKVYDRGGEPCLRCGTPITKDEITSRKTFYCQVCQH
ncbi:Fpg/Nei family DNA glycosylase [Ammoniphilus resinae]|uniref:Formamidopyrimidine-DNA glycosylase n=1 Tax=Ammoniphilus resinae TaxID=861532 RepID=A0ABS4GTN0_9BACL|nr:Fpg/Nei family DNA glycosylase [Ammoniphilus resinae]MBP1933632.1 formamidopyrimidine-DNA glycosylase [Ammoniphilus resinae]